jgi:putative redox protein
MYKVNTIYQNKMSFETQIDNHKLILDAHPEHGGEDQGPSPKKLILSSLAGCTGIDVVSLLNKMRVNFSELSIATEAELTEEHPKVFTYINVIFSIKVSNEEREKVEKAVTLSKERYCGVSAMLQKNCPVNYSINFL